jgi:hypothetical protein
MRTLLFVVLTASCVMAGCSTYRSRGSLDQFLACEIERHGGRAVAPVFLGDGLLSERWKFKRDRFGTVVWTRDIAFDNVDAFLRRIYGSPEEAGITNEQQQQWVIPARTAGVSIWYSREGDGVKITILQPLRIPD